MSQACDAGDSTQARALVAAAWKRVGRVDTLVNNAGQAAAVTRHLAG